MSTAHEHHHPPAAPARADDDNLLGVAILFLFYLACIGASAFLYWHGTGKLPWA